MRVSTVALYLSAYPFYSEVFIPPLKSDGVVAIPTIDTTTQPVTPSVPVTPVVDSDVPPRIIC